MENTYSKTLEAYIHAHKHFYFIYLRVGTQHTEHEFRSLRRGKLRYIPLTK